MSGRALTVSGSTSRRRPSKSASCEHTWRQGQCGASLLSKCGLVFILGCTAAGRLSLPGEAWYCQQRTGLAV